VTRIASDLRVVYAGKPGMARTTSYERFPKVCFEAATVALNSDLGGLDLSGSDGWNFGCPCTNHQAIVTPRCGRTRTSPVHSSCRRSRPSIRRVPRTPLFTCHDVPGPSVLTNLR